jgi:hypothetical protein
MRSRPPRSEQGRAAPIATGITRTRPNRSPNTSEYPRRLEPRRDRERDASRTLPALRRLADGGQHREI